MSFEAFPYLQQRQSWLLYCAIAVVTCVFDR